MQHPKNIVLEWDVMLNSAFCLNSSILRVCVLNFMFLTSFLQIVLYDLCCC